MRNNITIILLPIVFIAFSPAVAQTDIAAILEVRGRTVAKHLERTFRVLGVDNRTAAAAKAHQVMRRKTDPR